MKMICSDTHAFEVCVMMRAESHMTWGRMGWSHPGSGYFELNGLLVLQPTIGFPASATPAVTWQHSIGIIFKATCRRRPLRLSAY